MSLLPSKHGSKAEREMGFLSLSDNLAGENKPTARTGIVLALKIAGLEPGLWLFPSLMRRRPSLIDMCKQRRDLFLLSLWRRYLTRRIWVQAQRCHQSRIGPQLVAGVRVGG